MSASDRIELDQRVIDGITVTLSWRPVDDTTWLDVTDSKCPSNGFNREVASADAWWAFNHPFAAVAVMS